jgi:hypothetical protein
VIRFLIFTIGNNYPAGTLPAGLFLFTRTGIRAGKALPRATSLPMAAKR